MSITKASHIDNILLKKHVKPMTMNPDQLKNHFINNLPIPGARILNLLSSAEGLIEH